MIAWIQPARTALSMAGHLRTGLRMTAALALDVGAGEPAEQYHPVCLMGKAVNVTERVVDRMAPQWDARRLYGAVAAVALPAGVYVTTWTALKLVPRRLSGLTEAALLATAIAVRSLGEAARGVDEGLAVSLDEGRSRVACMVGRDTAGLDEPGVIRAAVESVAENANDAVVAPIFYGFIGGAPLALAYKMVNTLDSMIGYRNDRYSDFGWAAARLDDAAGYLPARLTALFAMLVSPMVRADPWAALSLWRRDARQHASPNAGVCESAFAGALGVSLGGPGTYGGRAVDAPVIGRGLRAPQRPDISRANSLMYGVATMSLLAGTLASFLARAARGRSKQSLASEAKAGRRFPRAGRRSDA